MHLPTFFATHKARFAFLMRYAISGALAGAVQTGALYLWVSVLGLEAYYLWGVVLGFCATTVIGFVLQKYWTFRGRAQQHVPHKQFLFFILLAVAGLGLNALLLNTSKLVLEGLGFNFFHVWYVVAEAAVILFVAMLSFLVNYLFIFKSSAV